VIRSLPLLLVVALAATACASGGGASNPTAQSTTGEPDRFGSPPELPEGELSAAAATARDELLASLDGEVDATALSRLGDTNDARLAWFITDLQRFLPFDSAAAAQARFALRKLTGVVTEPVDSYGMTIDHLIAWDLPSYPGYREDKGTLFVLIEPAWSPFFAEDGTEIDHRLLQWGGVFIDDRPLGAPDPVTRQSTSGGQDDDPEELCPRGCIPGLDDPAITDAAGGAWYDDDGIVFGVIVDGEARAYPKNIMEVHEMVNDTLGGRRIGMPYCTLCGSAQVYFTDGDAESEIPVLRTSGLLTRSNKVMYDLNTFSVFDTFTGRALSGPLQGTELEQVSTVVTTWGLWKDAHPETTIVAEDGGLGRTYPVNPLGGRDADGPIFPIGDVDPRLPVQEPVLGVIGTHGAHVAFPTVAATLALESGETVEFEGITVELDGGGLRATASDGEQLVGHQSFWFAWSQFHPDTGLWMR
jgi:hypothetical protein